MEKSHCVASRQTFAGVVLIIVGIWIVFSSACVVVCVHCRTGRRRIGGYRKKTFRGLRQRTSRYTKKTTAERRRCGYTSRKKKTHTHILWLLRWLLVSVLRSRLRLSSFWGFRVQCDFLLLFFCSLVFALKSCFFSSVLLIFVVVAGRCALSVCCRVTNRVDAMRWSRWRYDDDIVKYICFLKSSIWCQLEREEVVLYRWFS